MLQIKNLKMSYGNKEVLKDVSFRIKKGNIVGLLGVNGAGKSTIMNIITGYLRPSDGEVLINKMDIYRNPVEAKRNFGYLPEIPPLYKDMKVFEYLLFVAELKGIHNKNDEVNRVISLMDLEKERLNFIKKLSKGYQQRIGLAQALLGNPPVLILDEPLVGLDPAESKRMRTVLKNLKEEHAILISSHILSEIEELCNDVLILKKGTVIYNNSVKNAKKGKTSLEDAFIDINEEEN